MLLVFTRSCFITNCKSFLLPFLSYMSEFRLYIDESWDHSLKHINENFPFFLLCGVLISKKEDAVLSDNIMKLKQHFFGTNEVILHSRDIRRCEQHFQKLFDLNIKQQFYTHLNTILSETDFTIIASVVKKIDYIKKYGKSAMNPYNISLSYMLEKMVFCLDQYQATGVEIFVEKRGKKEDRWLLQHYHTIIDNGTFFVSPQRFNTIIKDFAFRHKYDNDIGIQIADLCAYPLLSHIRYPDSTIPSYSIIEPKIYQNPKTNKDSWLKIIP